MTKWMVLAVVLFSLAISMTIFDGVCGLGGPPRPEMLVLLGFAIVLSLIQVLIIHVVRVKQFPRTSRNRREED